MHMRVLTLVAAFCAVAATAFEAEPNNLPWYPSLQAFEHYEDDVNDQHQYD